MHGSVSLIRSLDKVVNEESLHYVYVMWGIGVVENNDTSDR